MVIYGIYNLDTVEKLINTVHKMHNSAIWIKNYLPINLILGIISIYPRMGLAIMLLISSYIKEH